MRAHPHLFHSPLGLVYTSVREDGAVLQLVFIDDEDDVPRLESRVRAAGYELERTASRCKQVERQVNAYLRGRREDLDLVPALEGTQFQRSVWKALLRIPRGKTRSYADIARTVRKPTAVRAVARANATNPVWLLVPCHRVIGSDGSLTGYGGGLDRKRRLLELEGALEPGPLFS